MLKLQEQLFSIPRRHFLGFIQGSYICHSNHTHLLLRSLHGTQEIIHDPCMKPRKSYMILAGKLGFHSPFIFETSEIIYGSYVNPRKSYMILE